MKTEVCRLIDDGPCDGRVNMAADRALLRACQEGVGGLTLRLYGWKTRTLTIGYSQKAAREVDPGRCRELDIPIVRRPTGGRAVLHCRELTYCLVAPVPHWRFPSNLKGAFATIARALLLGLKELGIQDGVAVAPRKGRPAQRLPSCFSTFNHREIAVCEKKLIGSAQRRTARAFLQHGSVLIDLDRELLNSLFIFNDPETRVRNLNILRESTTTLNEVCRRNLSFEEVSRAFRKGFERFFSGAVLTGELSPEEEIWRKEFLTTALKKTVKRPSGKES